MSFSTMNRMPRWATAGWADWRPVSWIRSQTLGIPAIGYGIRYEHGLFEQSFLEGRQIEGAESWLRQRFAWEFERPEVRYRIAFGGYVDHNGGKAEWHPSDTVVAQAFDVPVVGWQGKWGNTLRLWSAQPENDFDLESFNKGDYLAASRSEALARTISRVLYPDDTTEAGKELRLKQEYFFTAASINDLVRRFLTDHDDIRELPNAVAIQLNDTHPAIAGPELVRILADDHGLPLDAAISLARNCLGYTNHTLLPEALERWHEGLLGRVLPPASGDHPGHRRHATAGISRQPAHPAPRRGQNGRAGVHNGP